MDKLLILLGKRQINKQIKKIKSYNLNLTENKNLVENQGPKSCENLPGLCKQFQKCGVEFGVTNDKSCHYICNKYCHAHLQWLSPKPRIQA